MLNEEARAKIEVEMDSIVPCVATSSYTHAKNVSYIDDDPESLANFCIRQIDTWLCSQRLRENLYTPTEPITDMKIIEKLPARFKALALEELDIFNETVNRNKRFSELYYLGLKAVVEEDGVLAYYVVRTITGMGVNDMNTSFSPLLVDSTLIDEVDGGFHMSEYMRMKAVYEPDVKQD